MKLKELIALSESKEKKPSDVVYTLMELFEIYDYTIPDNNPFTEIQPMFWYDSDIIVGLTFYYRNDTFIAYSFQSGRKSNKRFVWVSEDTYSQIYNYCKSLEENRIINIDLINEDEELKNFYTVEFCNQLLPRRQTYTYCNCNVIVIENGDPKNYASQKAKIQYQDNTTEIVNVSDLLISYF